MPEKIVSSSLRPLFMVIVVGASLCAAATAVNGQAAVRQIRTGERENSARENEAMSPTRKRDPKEVMAQVNDDLLQLKALNEGVATHDQSDAQLQVNR